MPPPKIKHETLCNGYKAVRLQYIEYSIQNYSPSMLLDKKTL